MCWQDERGKEKGKWIRGREMDYDALKCTEFSAIFLIVDNKEDVDTEQL